VLTNPLAAMFGRPVSAVDDHYPELRPLLRAVRRRDWQGVVGYFDTRPAGEDLSLAVGAAADVKGAEDFFQQMVDEQRTPLARTLLGERCAFCGSTARPAYPKPCSPFW
jgi:hypothetical protein